MQLDQNYSSKISRQDWSRPNVWPANVQFIVYSCLLIFHLALPTFCKFTIIFRKYLKTKINKYLNLINTKRHRHFDLEALRRYIIIHNNIIIIIIIQNHFLNLHSCMFYLLSQVEESPGTANMNTTTTRKGWRRHEMARNLIWCLFRSVRRPQRKNLLKYLYVKAYFNCILLSWKTFEQFEIFRWHFHVFALSPSS